MKIELPANMSIVGSTKSGKTYLMKKMLKDFLPKIDYLVILSPTCELSGDFKCFGNNTNPEEGTVVHTFDNVSEFKSIINEIVSSQDKISRAHSKMETPSLFLVLDDCVNTNILSFKGIIDSLSTRSRHYNLSIAILAQRMRSIPSTFRLNTKYFILFSCSNMLEMERFLEEYCIKSERKNIRSALKTIYAEPYNFIFADNFQQNPTKRLLKNGKEYILKD